MSSTVRFGKRPASKISVHLPKQNRLSLLLEATPTTRAGSGDREHRGAPVNTLCALCQHTDLSKRRRSVYDHTPASDLFRRSARVAVGERPPGPRSSDISREIMVTRALA